jgi:alcohol dehydrogenase
LLYSRFRRLSRKGSIMLNVRFFQTTPRMVIGPGCVAQLADEIRRLGARKLLVVTDPGLVATGIVARVEESLLAAGLVLDRFDSVESDPRYEIATKAAESAQSFGAEVIIGIGGGSPLDIAKAASVLVTNEGSVNSFFGIDLLKQPGLPTILVPTTAGTGSEVTPIAILSDEAEKLKKGIVSPFLFPRTAILDPELTLGLPPGVTAATGMDALIHAVEAYTSKNASSLTDMAAVEAMSLIAHNIRKAFADGSNIEARANMLEGSMLAGMAFANAGVTAVHAFAYPIGAEFHIPHGIANSIMLIPVMEFNMLANFSKFADMAEILGGDTEGLTDREAAFEAIEVLRDLSEDLQIPTGLSGYGITESDIPGLAAGVMKVTRLLANNPRQLTLSDAEAIYLKAL